MFACWHSDLFASAAFFRRKPVTALVSESRDGQILVDILSGAGMDFVRGSSSSKGAWAARRSLAILASGRSLATTWDGPRGPRGEAKPGPAWIAGKARTRLLGMEFRYGPHVRLGDWSKLVIPAPFSKVGVRWRDAGAAP